MCVVVVCGWAPRKVSRRELEEPIFAFIIYHIFFFPYIYHYILKASRPALVLFSGRRVEMRQPFQIWIECEYEYKNKIRDGFMGLSNETKSIFSRFSLDFLVTHLITPHVGYHPLDVKLRRRIWQRKTTAEATCTHTSVTGMGRGITTSRYEHTWVGLRRTRPGRWYARETQPDNLVSISP